MKKISRNVFSILLILNYFDEVYAVKVNILDEDDDYIIDLSQFGSRIFGSPITSNENGPTGNANFQQSDNPEESGPYLQGDLLIPSTQRNGMRAESYRWRNGEIPFEIKGSFSKFSNIFYKTFNENCQIL